MKVNFALNSGLLLFCRLKSVAACHLHFVVGVFLVLACHVQCRFLIIGFSANNWKEMTKVKIGFKLFSLDSEEDFEVELLQD